MEPSADSPSVQIPPASPQRDQQSGAQRNNHYRRGGNRGGDRGRGPSYRGQGRGRGFRQDDNRERPARKIQDQGNTIRPIPTIANTVATEQTVDGSESTKTGEENGDEDIEAEVCFICASQVVHNSVAQCNHRTCHICALRMRALYKNKACLHCRTNSDFVIFTDDPNKRYADYIDQDFARTDDVLGIQYEKPDIFEDTVLLLRYNCPDESCDISCYGWPDLHRHVRNVHGKVMCDLCTRNKKVFTHEHTLFTHNELRKHERYGDDQPGAIDQSGFKGHPECGFCHQRFYGDDELYTHCREKHERCHICDRRGGNRQQQYYLDYDALEAHFKKEHFTCQDAECLEKKFIVFESEMDLKAHQLEAHPNGLTKDARRDTRRVDMSSFNYRASTSAEAERQREERRQERRNNQRQAQGPGRGRDPNVEALPVSSAQPMRRDELAYQRQLAIHSAQSVSTRTFGGALTSDNNTRPTAAPITTTNNTTTATADHDPATSQTTPTAETIPFAKLPPYEQARQLRHQAVLSRASALLNNSTPKLSIFRTKISDYRNGTIAADALIDSFFGLFDSPSSEIGTLLKELADIYESTEKRAALLKAWNDWRAINEDYPSLPEQQNGLGSAASAGSGGKRILKLKSSTAKSSKTTAARTGTWAVASGSTGPSRPPAGAVGGPAFPHLPPSSRAGPGKVTTTAAWATAATPSTGVSVSSTARPSPAPSRPASIARPPNTAASSAFPSLPAAQKPGMNVSRPGFIGNPVLKVRSGTSSPAVNAWGGGGSGGAAMNMGSLSAALDAAAADEDDVEGGGKGKGKGKKKQTLYHWG